MPNPVKNEPIVLTLPADRNLLLVIRLTTAGVVARAGITVDRMDDLKMAVEEACACLTDQGNAPGRLCLSYAAGEAGLEIRVEAVDAGADAGSRTEEDLEIERCILESLVDKVDFELRNGWIHAVRMTSAAAQ